MYNRYHWKKILLIIIVIPLLLSSCAQEELVIESNKTAVQNVFFQPWERYLENNIYDWNDIFENLAQANINQITIQWTQYGDENLLSDKSHGDLIEQIIFFAKKYQIKIVFGLYQDPLFFQRISQKNIKIHKYLALLKQKSIGIAKQIISKHGGENIISGFYIPQEIDDLNWNSADRIEALSIYIHSLSQELNQISKPHPLYISGFYNRNSSIIKYINMWDAILQNNKSIIVLIQNGTGANNIPQSVSLDYYDRFYDQLPKNQWGIIVELFTTSKKNHDQFVVANSKVIKKNIQEYENKYKNISINLFSLIYLIDNNYKLLRSINQ